MNVGAIPSHENGDKNIEKLLANELNQLSFRERNDINEEIHGVLSPYDKNLSPDSIARHLQEFDFELQHNIPAHRKEAYERSQKVYKEREQREKPEQKSPTSSSTTDDDSDREESPPSIGYINDPDFRILFLRHELWNVSLAALRFARFLDLVYELWGENALTEKMWTTHHGFNAFEWRAFQSGNMQCLRGRDRVGRRILGNFADDTHSKLSVENRLRMSLYCMMHVAQDVETQRKGAVGIAMFHNVSIDDLQKRSVCHKRLVEAVPIRFSAIHLCLPQENHSPSRMDTTQSSSATTTNLLPLIKAMFVMSLGTRPRRQLRIHMGSFVECMYALQSFGILPEQVPVNATTGKVKVKQHLQWMDLMVQREEALKANEKFEKIECAGIKDVLFGRGWPIMKHPGNVHFRGTIQACLERYKNETTKRAKTLVAQSIVKMVKVNGGRFLKEDSGWWVEVTDDMARQKVSIAFRDARKKEFGTLNNNAQGRRMDMGMKIGKTTGITPMIGSNHSGTSAFLGMDGSSALTGMKRQRTGNLDLENSDSDDNLCYGKSPKTMCYNL